VAHALPRQYRLVDALLATSIALPVFTPLPSRCSDRDSIMAKTDSQTANTVQSAATQDGEYGDAQARSRDVASLFQQHNQLLLRFLRARLGSEHEAKEVAQEAYVRLLQLDRTGAVSFLRSYLFKVALNLAIDRLRERTKRPVHADPIELFEELEGTAEPERAAIADEELHLLDIALNELPPKCRHALVLHRYHDKTQREIAAELGMSERTIRSYLVQAMLYCKLRLNGLSAVQADAVMNQ
jgi:RNA polymerase sigma factor (sigma-70 family)